MCASQRIVSYKKDHALHTAALTAMNCLPTKTYKGSQWNVPNSLPRILSTPLINAENLSGGKGRSDILSFGNVSLRRTNRAHGSVSRKHPVTDKTGNTRGITHVRKRFPYSPPSRKELKRRMRELLHASVALANNTGELLVRLVNPL